MGLAVGAVVAGIAGLWRALLLTALAFGIVGMHTFGHDAIAAGAAPHRLPALTAHGLAEPDVVEPVVLAAGHDAPRHPGSPHEPLSPLSICLAILSMAIIAAAFRWLLMKVSALPLACRGIAGEAAGFGRGPPAYTPVGRRLVSASVLRI